MRPALALLAMVVTSATAGAEPAASPARTAAREPATCGVRVRRAPSEIAPRLVEQIATLGACGGRLDVWIVRTEGGLYVIARDELGRVRDRVVPELEVAAALIASWVEVDAAAPVVGVPRDGAAVAALEPPRPSPPSVTPIAARKEVPAFDATRPFERAIGLALFAGATTANMTTAGGNLSIDVVNHTGVTIALALEVSRDIASSYYVVRWDDGFSRETGRWGGAAFAELAHRTALGRFRIAPAFRVGAGPTRHEILTARDSGPGVVSDAVLRADVTLGVRVGASLGIGYQVASGVELEATGGWLFTGYSYAGAGVTPSEHAVVGGFGLRHRR